MLKTKLVKLLGSRVSLTGVSGAEIALNPKLSDSPGANGDWVQEGLVTV